MEQSAGVVDLPQIARERKPYYIGLDAVRLLAALMVGALHLTFENAAGSHLAFFGYVGVQVFFVVSGLVVANSANHATAMEFVKRRFLRLYPGAWICSILGVLPLLAAHAGSRLISHAFFKSMTLFPKGPWLGYAYWTLPIEMVFYALITVLICTGVFYRLQLVASLLTIVSFCYLTIIASSWVRFGSGGWLDTGYGLGNMLLVRYGVFFGMGVLLWMNQQGLLTRIGRVALGFALVGAQLEIFCRSEGVAQEFAKPIDNTLLLTGAFIAFNVCLLFIFLASKHPIFEAQLRKPLARSLRALGLASYPFYLLHEAIGLPMVAQLTGFKVMPFWLAVTVAVISVLVLSLLVSGYAEPRLRRVTRRVIEGLGSAYFRQMPMLRVFYRTTRPIA